MQTKMAISIRGRKNNMGKLATDETLQKILEGITGADRERTAKVVNINFDSTMFETGGIDNTTGQNKNESGFYRTSGYITVPADKWKIQLYADRPWSVNIYYYDANHEYQERDFTETGYCNILNYPYCRLKFYHLTDYAGDVAEFVDNSLKIQYIENTPAENEYFLHNHLFNGNFEYDRNNDGVADGWTTINSPASVVVSDKTLIVTPSATGEFIRMNSNNKLTGHKIYISFTAYTPDDLCFLTVYQKTLNIAKNSKYTRTYGIITAVNSSLNPTFGCRSGSVSHEISIRNVMMIDLTDIYGAGNEPNAEEITAIIDTYYDGYVPCDYVVRYDDGTQVDSLTILRNIENELLSDDTIIVKNGYVSSVKHYVAGELRSTAQIKRDKFGNLISVGEL